MPIEMQSQTFLFNRIAPGNVGKDRVADAQRLIKAKASLMAPETGKRRAPDRLHKSVTLPIDEVIPKHIPLHDLEAFWWVSVVLSIRRELEGAVYDPQERAAAYAFHLFARNLLEDFETRRGVMTSNDVFKHNIAGLHPYLRVAGKKLEVARELLRCAYQAAEANIAAVDCTTANNIYGRFIEAYGDIHADMSANGDFDFKNLGSTFLKQPAETILPLASLSLDSRTRKRTRLDSHDDNPFVINEEEEVGHDKDSTAAKRARRDDSDSASVVSVPMEDELEERAVEEALSECK